MASPAAYFAGRHVLITGGSMGIGLATARRLVELGAGVTLAARTRDALERAADDLRGRRAGASVRTLQLDVADAEAVADGLRRELAEQPLDMLVNCAGIARAATFAETGPEDLRRHMDVNYFGAVWTTLAVVPHFLERGRGHVVNVGSTASVIGIYGYAAYSPPKFALYGLSEVLRAELAPRGIRVSVVLPSSTRTAMLEAELAEAPPETAAILASTRILSAEQVARELIRGVARGRFEIIPGAHTRITTWAYRMAPSIGRRVLDRDARRGAR